VLGQQTYRRLFEEKLPHGPSRGRGLKALESDVERSIARPLENCAGRRPPAVLRQSVEAEGDAETANVGYRTLGVMKLNGHIRECDREIRGRIVDHGISRHRHGSDGVVRVINPDYA
jgi:hypothetical protein